MTNNILVTDRRLRVSLALGLALVLLCGAIGLIIGAFLPIEAFLQP